MQPQHIGGCRTMLPQIIRAQPTQKRTGGIAAAAAPDRINAPTRDTGQVPGPIPSGTATSRASRRRSRRSSTRQDKRTHARLRTQITASVRTNAPNASLWTQTTRTRQRRAAQAAQTAVGDAQLRILFRDDHAESFRQRKVTSHQAKSAFLWGYPRFFWQDKRNGVQKTKQGAYSGVLLFYFFSCIVFRSSPQACGCSRSRRSCRGK